MIKRKFIKVTLRQGESLNRENFKDCTCLLVMKGCFVVFNNRGEIVFRLAAGEANVVSGCYEFTGTATADDTEVIVV